MKTVQEYFDATLIRPRMARSKIWCMDGFHISVQASVAHCCEPQENVAIYSQVECGHPSKKSELLLPFANPGIGDVVYTNVPIEIVDELLQSHGGIDVEKTMGKK